MSLLFLIVMGSSVCAQNNYRNWTVVNESKKENIALIIANNTYESGGSLIQPIPTAKKLEDKLKAEGFDVLVGRDLNRMHMISILDDFSNKFQNYDFAMIFYLGHGFQINGENYLIPTDANPGSKDDVEVHAINVDYVMRKINDPKTPKVIVLDACRDNPFAQNWSSSERSGSNNGFGNVSAPRNAEIFFTTGEGTRVRDDNPYLSYFMQELKQGACLSDIKRIVSKRIYEYNSDQIPASYGQLFDKVCFGSAPIPDPVVVVKDSDGDGIIDSEDNCPYEYGVASYSGCPAPKVTVDSAEYWYSKGDELYDRAFELELMEKEDHLNRAFKLTEKAAKAGLMKAQRRLGWMYRYDQGTPGYSKGDDNWRDAIYWYTKAAEQGSTSSQKYLAELYRDGEVYNVADFFLAKFWYEKAIEGGDTECLVYLGELYEKGWVTKRDSIQIKYNHAGEPDLKTARDLYQQCYEAGLVIGKYYLARSYDWEVFAFESYRNENTGYKKKSYDVQEAIRIYTEAANEGYAPAMLRIFELYCKKQNRDYVAQTKYNQQVGIDLLIKGADTGDVACLYQLGVSYKYGWNGVKKDKYKGEQLLKRACEAGYRIAC